MKYRIITLMKDGEELYRAQEKAWWWLGWSDIRPFVYTSPETARAVIRNKKEDRAHKPRIIRLNL